jgi:DNA mismatch repair protein MutS2
MKVISQESLEKIEFNKVIAAIKVYCQGEPALHYFSNISISTNLQFILDRLSETKEYLEALCAGLTIPSSTYGSIESIIPLLKKEGYVLDIDEIASLYQTLTLSNNINIYFQDYQKQKLFPRLSNKALSILVDARLVKEIERVFDEQGEIRPNASDELTKISKAISNKEREVLKIFRVEMGSYKDRGFLVENLESVRNNRMVLVVAAEHKRKIAGIIHDESATGKTVFIEPEATIAVNNEIHSLYSERRAEIYRIIRDLCNFMRPYGDEILMASEVIADLDTIRAKALFARSIDAKVPIIGSKPTFDFKIAYNPILLLRKKEGGHKVIPFDLNLYGDNKILVISGPNAGGKSVTMKTVALLQIMIQAGIPIPADENSKFGIFESFFVDIGDQQSLEDDLSTYSSHLTNMKRTLENANDRTLFVIDEFGSGTDPKIGGAIAEAVLSQLLYQKSFGVITTHYSNLKFFAYKTKGMVNGSMEFDKVDLKPSYQLLVGKPGSSFAFEIAQKIGLPERVINYARNKAGKNEKAIEELLVDLQAERQEYEAKMMKVLEKEEQLDKLIISYNELQNDLEYKRKKLKKDQKEASLFAIAEAAKEAQKLVKQLKSEKDLEKAQKILEEKKQEQLKINNEIIELKEDILVTTHKTQKPIVKGDFVKMHDSTTIGQVITIDKNDFAEIQMGILKLKAPLRDLIRANEPIEVNRKKSIDLSQVSGVGAKYETKLDLRGYRVEEAMWFLEEFVDKALINNAFELRIIHGVGNGVLKRKVHQKLKEYKSIKEYWHPEPEYGGEGVTLVRL